MNKIELEKKFIDIIRMKKYSHETEKAYCYHLNKFLWFKNNKPITGLSSQDINDYLVSLNDSDVSDSYFNQAINAIRFFFKYALNRKVKDYLVVRPKRAKTQPILLDITEIQGIFNSCSNIKHKAILSLLYSAGLRCSEVINLKIEDVDSKLMVIRIHSAKGRKDRMVPLDKDCLVILRLYYKKYKPHEYLFNGQFDIQYSKRSIQEFIKKYSILAGVKKNVYPHLFRHNCLTNLIESGTDIRIAQVVAGHENIKTTMEYAHISPKFISQVQTPLNQIRL